MGIAPVVIAEYSAEWPVAFAAEREALIDAFRPLAVEIEHIGSTSVPGLGAKPTIDILLGSCSLQEIESRIGQLELLGYRYVPEFEKELPHRRYFDRPPMSGPGVHLHAVVAGSAFWTEHLAFRDALRNSHTLANQYLELKRRLSGTFGADRAGYTDAKAPFIRAVIDEHHRRA
jgi:GrpB-like predicted nucleotidyltransferase (UPF0157 family)